MRVVIYDPETMEAITIIEAPVDYFHGLERGEHHDRRVFLIPDVLPLRPFDQDRPIEPLTLRTVTIKFEKLVRDHVSCWTGFADNPELCLLLRSTFLPGQQKEVRAHERAAARAAFADIISRAMGRPGWGEAA